MSGRLGLIPYPTVDPSGATETNPLKKYQDQLDPLAKITDQLWQTPRAPGLAPIQPPTAAMKLSQLGEQAMTPSVTGQPPQLPTPLAPPGPPQGAAVPPGQMAPGGPTDVTQFQQDPATGGITRGPGAAVSRRLAAMGAGEVPTASGPGSQALAQAGAAQGAPEEAPTPMPEDAPEQSRSQDRISQRIPSEPAQRKAGIDAHATADLPIDYTALKQAPDQFTKNAKIIKEHYPGFEHLRTNDPDKINEAFIKHAAGNLTWLYRKMRADKNIGPGIVERAKRWYSGANKIAHNLAKEYGVKPHQAAAVLAALSPQKDWYQNVHLARKVFEAHKLGHNWTLTPEMHAYSERYLTQMENDPKKDAEDVAKMRELRDKFATTPMARLTDPYERAVFARWHDEAHNPRSYQMVTPEGEMAGTAMIPAKYYKSGKRKGELQEASRPRDVTWGSFNEISKAMAALQDASLPQVSRLMGGAHKVRNFFNNIIAPLHGHDVTIDTHAIAAALLRPLGAGAMEVAHGLGTNPKQPKDKTLPRLPQAGDNATLGNKGLYGLYAEAYRRAAKELGVLPRELQSVTWEGIRGLFSPEQKRNKTFVKEIEDMWRNRGEHRGKTPDERRETIVAHAGGLKPPSWAGGEDHGDDAEE